MNPMEREPFSQAEWESFEDELVERAKDIARRTLEQVRKAAGGEARGDKPGPDDPAGEVPVFG
jgi:hypothetical protein